MSDAVREVIQRGDAVEFERLVLAQPDLRDGAVSFGDGSGNTASPLHLVCDAVFRDLIEEEQALALTEVLLAAGLDPGSYRAKSGDTYLIAAASLGAETVGLRLVEFGVDVRAQGLFGATALHWAAFMGLDHLAEALIGAGADLELADDHHDCTPLQWTLHAWSKGTNGRRDGLPLVAGVLVGRGAIVPEGALAGLVAETDAALRAVLGGA